MVKTCKTMTKVFKGTVEGIFKVASGIVAGVRAVMKGITDAALAGLSVLTTVASNNQIKELSFRGEVRDLQSIHAAFTFDGRILGKQLNFGFSYALHAGFSVKELAKKCFDYMINTIFPKIRDMGNLVKKKFTDMGDVVSKAFLDAKNAITNALKKISDEDYEARLRWINHNRLKAIAHADFRTRAAKLV